MRGRVLTYDQLRGEGLISAENGERYTFAGIEWKSPPHQLRAGAGVDFSPAGSAAVGIYSLAGAGGGMGGTSPLDSGEKSNVVAGLLALFLGGFGVHRFYLGYNNEGIILLVGTIISWVLMIIVIGLLGLMAIGIICLIEAVIYLTKSPEEFRATYVEGRKPWF